MSNACELRTRVVNGRLCAKQFGIKVAEDEGRPPTSDETDEHLNMAEAGYSAGYKSQLRSIAYSAAMSALNTSESKPALQYRLNRAEKWLARAEKQQEEIEVELKNVRAANEVLTKTITQLVAR